MTRNNQKLALLTGAAGVLGSETSRALAADGYRVVMVDLDGNQLEALAQEIGRGAYPLSLDVADPQNVAEACAKIRRELGQVSVLVNNAGVLSNHKAAETANDEWRRILAVNLDGAFYLCREWLPGMKADRWGRIINVYSGALSAVAGLSKKTRNDKYEPATPFQFQPDRHFHPRECTFLLPCRSDKNTHPHPYGPNLRCAATLPCMIAWGSSGVAGVP